jgi:hypothetical protein
VRQARSAQPNAAGSLLKGVTGVVTRHPGLAVAGCLLGIALSVAVQVLGSAWKESFAARAMPVRAAVTATHTDAFGGGKITVRYDWRGAEYETTHNVVSTDPYERGDDVRLLVDPNDPAVAHLEKPGDFMPPVVAAWYAFPAVAGGFGLALILYLHLRGQVGRPDTQSGTSVGVTSVGVLGRRYERDLDISMRTGVWRYSSAARWSGAVAVAISLASAAQWFKYREPGYLIWLGVPVALWFLLYRPRVVLRENGVEVRNAIRKLVIPWDGFGRVEGDDVILTRRTPMGAQTDGRRFHCSVVATTGFDFFPSRGRRHRGAELAAELRRHVAAGQAARSSGGGG